MTIITKANTHINTSEIGTEWGYAVHADINKYLRENEIVSKGFWWRLNVVMNILKYPFLILGAVYYLLWHINSSSSNLVIMIGFLVAGTTLLFREFYIFFKPPKPYQAIVIKDKRINISIHLLLSPC